MIRMTLIALLIGCSWFSTAAAEELDGIDCRAGTTNTLHAADDLGLLTFDSYGVMRSQNSNTAWDGASTRCIGMTGRTGEERQAGGYCKWQDADGHFAFAHWVLAGKSGGTWKFIGGTGKWEGLTGSGEWGYAVRSKPVEAGTFQFCYRISGSYRKAG